ncbi:hypothetical protein [Rummeliibacillus pycnus]|uniref:hypothetical protein n=1 Tax=Rummeliibacillus pycnus TaxID=101070 RepID=UPI003D2B5025
MTNEKYTVAGTNIEEVKRQNAQSGPTYNEIKEMAANHEFDPTANGNMIDPDTPKKYTWTGTDIEEVKRLNAASGPSYNQIFEMLDRELESKEIRHNE